MPMYRVIWEIDIEADTPKEAAFEAWMTMRREGSGACVFTCRDGSGTETTHDLLEDERPAGEAVQEEERRYRHHPDNCPSNHWNDGTDICADCGEDLNPPTPAA